MRIFLLSTFLFATVLLSSPILEAADILKEKGAAESAVKSKSTDGTFVRIDEGDYFHWVISTKGEELSFFILHADAAVEKVIEDPEKYVGKKCRVLWKESMEDIPEAGGKMKVKQILSVTWLAKK